MSFAFLWERRISSLAVLSAVTLVFGLAFASPIRNPLAQSGNGQQPSYSFSYINIQAFLWNEVLSGTIGGQIPRQLIVSNGRADAVDNLVITLPHASVAANNNRSTVTIGNGQWSMEQATGVSCDANQCTIGHFPAHSQVNFDWTDDIKCPGTNFSVTTFRIGNSYLGQIPGYSVTCDDYDGGGSTYDFTVDRTFSQVVPDGNGRGTFTTTTTIAVSPHVNWDHLPLHLRTQGSNTFYNHGTNDLNTDAHVTGPSTVQPTSTFNHCPSNGGDAGSCDVTLSRPGQPGPGQSATITTTYSVPCPSKLTLGALWVGAPGPTVIAPMHDINCEGPDSVQVTSSGPTDILEQGQPAHFQTTIKNVSQQKMYVAPVWELPQTPHNGAIVSVDNISCVTVDGEEVYCTPFDLDPGQEKTFSFTFSNWDAFYCTGGTSSGNNETTYDASGMLAKPIVKYAPKQGQQINPFDLRQANAETINGNFRCFVEGSEGEEGNEGPSCGNNQCEEGENYFWSENYCPQDCNQGPVCGNHICEENEEESCPQDCTGMGGTPGGGMFGGGQIGGAVGAAGGGMPGGAVGAAGGGMPGGAVGAAGGGTPRGLIGGGGGTNRPGGVGGGIMGGPVGAVGGGMIGGPIGAVGGGVMGGPVGAVGGGMIGGPRGSESGPGELEGSKSGPEIHAASIDEDAPCDTVSTSDVPTKTISTTVIPGFITPTNVPSTTVTSTPIAVPTSTSVTPIVTSTQNKGDAQGSAASPESKPFYCKFLKYFIEDCY